MSDSSLCAPRKGSIHYMTDTFRIVGTPTPERKYVFFDIGKGNPDLYAKEPYRIYELFNVAEKARDHNGRDIVIEGKPHQIIIGNNAAIGERVVIRSDEVPLNENFQIDGTIGDGAVFHWQNNYLKRGVECGKYVTFHGSIVGKDARIGRRSILDTKSNIPAGCDVGDCCYIPIKIEKDLVESGTVYFGTEIINLPTEAVRYQFDVFNSAFIQMKSSSAKEHRANGFEIGYFDPLAFVDLPQSRLYNNPNNIYVGPFAYIHNCEFMGSNINIQDHNYREATTFMGHNIGAHGVLTRNVIMKENSAALFHAVLENVIMEKGSVAGPLATIVGVSSIERLVIPENMVVAGYVTPKNYHRLINDGEVRESGRLIATLKPIDKYQGLKDRLEHIDKQNADEHSKKESSILAVPTQVLFDFHTRREALEKKPKK